MLKQSLVKGVAPLIATGQYGALSALPAALNRESVSAWGFAGSTLTSYRGLSTPVCLVRSGALGGYMRIIVLLRGL